MGLERILQVGWELALHVADPSKRNRNLLRRQGGRGRGRKPRVFGGGTLAHGEWLTDC